MCRVLSLGSCVEIGSWQGGAVAPMPVTLEMGHLKTSRPMHLHPTMCTERLPDRIVAAAVQNQIVAAAVQKHIVATVLADAVAAAVLQMAGAGAVKKYSSLPLYHFPRLTLVVVVTVAKGIR